jgi:site-specific recombinase XerD
VLEGLRAWSAWMEATDHRAETIRSYRYWLVRFAADTLIDPWDTTEDDLVSYLASLPRHGISRQMFLRSVRSFWQYAEPKAGRNPAARLHLRRPKDSPAPSLSRWRCER